ncbi:hypothetical protein ABZP36_007441 [Zizania latifolia]
MLQLWRELLTVLKEIELLFGRTAKASKEVSGMLEAASHVPQRHYALSMSKLDFNTKEEKDNIEQLFMGLNMPTKTVAFTSVKKWDGDTNRYIGSGEYIQMSGRADRRGKDERGICVIMVNISYHFFSGIARNGSEDYKVPPILDGNQTDADSNTAGEKVASRLLNKQKRKVYNLLIMSSSSMIW